MPAICLLAGAYSWICSACTLDRNTSDSTHQQRGQLHTADTQYGKQTQHEETRNAQHNCAEQQRSKASAACACVRACCVLHHTVLHCLTVLMKPTSISNQLSTCCNKHS